MRRWMMTAVIPFAALVTSACERGADDDAETIPDVGTPAVDPELATHLPEGATLEMAGMGQELYPVCGVCHGMEGQGTELGPALGAAGSVPTIDGIAAVIRAGADASDDFGIPMPAYGPEDFSDEQVRAIATYVFLLGREGAAPE